MRKLTLSFDFDNCVSIGTCYPRIGKLRPFAKEVIKKCYHLGHTVIINTCRTGEHAMECYHFLTERGIPYSYINENSHELIKRYGTDTRKISADLYFDDRSTPIDWRKIGMTIELFQKPTVICIVGPSGCGKTTLAEYITETWNIPLIQSRTTRARRTPDENGHTFVTEAEFDSYSKEDMIAFTTFGTARYCCLKSDVENRNTYVIDESGLRYLRDNFSNEYNIFAIRIYRPEIDRIKDVGEERAERDKGKFTMVRSEFDAIIQQCTTVEDLCDQADNIISQNMLYI
jgi:guanylate kinase